MVQAFGREDDVQARFSVKAEAVRDGVLRQARVEAAFLPGLLFLPTVSIGAVVLFGGHDVINGALTYGEFFLFYQLLVQMVWPLEALGWILSLGQRATASASRSLSMGVSFAGTVPVPGWPARRWAAWRCSMYPGCFSPVTRRRPDPCCSTPAGSK